LESCGKKLTEQDDLFEKGKHEHGLVHTVTGLKIDLVPFGGLEKNDRIRWPDGACEMNVFGFSDAFENAIRVRLTPDLELTVATIELLVAPKFFAFKDRRLTTDRDLPDLWHVMQNYVLDGREPELYDHPFSLVVDEAFDWEYARPLLVGHDVGRACKPATVERLMPILEELSDPYFAGINPLVGGSNSAEAEEARRKRVSTSFHWVLKGLQLPR
jgi:predicted nucleotidyltransferase